MIFFIQLTDALHYGEKQRCQRGEEGWMEGLALSLSVSRDAMRRLMSEGRV